MGWGSQWRESNTERAARREMALLTGVCVGCEKP